MSETTEQLNNNAVNVEKWEEISSINYFNKFLKTFVVGNKSYISEKEEVIEPKNVESTYNNYCGISIKDGKDRKFSEIENEIMGDNNYKGIDIEILNHAIFLWGLPNNRKSGWVIKKETKEKNNKGQKNNPYRDMPICSVGGGGSGYVQTKVKGIRFILYIFTQIFGKSSDDAKKVIKEICIGNYKKDGNEVPYGEGKDQESLPDGVKNFLLHLCDNVNYEPIASTSDKKKIVKTFIKGEVDDNKIDACIIAIKKEILGLESQLEKPKFTNKIEILKSLLPDDEKKSGEFSFYNDKINWFWRGESDGDNLSRVKLLEYKKAMVLYGPPGTGKTYTAMELAKEMLVRYWVKQYENGAKEKLADCIDNIKKITEIKDLIEENKKEEKNIYYLQLHVNYSYENFIAGQVIKDGNIVTQEGFIFKLVAAAQDEINRVKRNNANITEENKKEKPKPFVVILDEMNRVDVSRVFGELFTAIEKRNTPVDLTLPDPQNPGKRLTLTIPENIYFIGTMNEIDFSLEQLDFALRRRFIWELADYNSDSLEQIITSRLSDDLSNKKDLLNNNIGNISKFIECCDNVNKTIEGHNSLGKEYHIGHAFFAEIAEIIKKHPTKDFMKSKKILWQISILPTLEAYCGTMDSSEKKTFIEKCKASYEKSE